MQKPRHGFRVTTFACLVSLANVADAQLVPLTQRAVDSVAVKGGPRLYGAILSRDKDGTTTIAVQREWLKSISNSFLQKQEAIEAKDGKIAMEKRAERLREWIKHRANEKDLVSTLRAELQRVEADAAKPLAAKPSQAQFVLVKVPGDQVRTGFKQPAKHRQIALLAWKQQLADIESRTAKSLVKELADAGKIPDGNPVDLSDRLPRVSLESDKQWAARQAIVEFDALKRVRFQGTEATLFRAGGDSKPPDIAKIFNRIYKSQLDDLLNEALGNGKHAGTAKKWKDAVEHAAKTADAEHVRGFRITRVNPSLANHRVVVEEHFVAKMPGGPWEIVWTHRESIDASKKRPDIEAWIKDDERVKQALSLVKSLGLGADESQITQAIRFGAATKIAQEAADGKFTEFRNTYRQKWDAAPIRWRHSP